MFVDRVMKVILGITGASGSVYARLLAEKLLRYGGVELSVIATANGREVMRWENEGAWLSSPDITLFDNGDMFAAPASGSAGYDALVVIPCSMGTIGRLSAGVSDSLLTRAADVMLKERRKLILVPRETPLNTIHLRNMTALSECGAIVCPASPSFYSRPENIEQLCTTVTDRVVSLLGLDAGGYIWGQ